MEKYPMTYFEISIHAPTKGATYRGDIYLIHEEISIHAPTKGATKFNPHPVAINVISIHAPTKGATIPLVISIIGISEFQSTLPRRERQVKNSGEFKTRDISIHAPTKGATSYNYRQRRENEYFNPRSHEGSDFKMTKDRLQQLDFNPRSHEGSDTVSKDFYPDLFISIHAPTKGATQKKLCIICCWVFQSTLPRRERP